MTGPQSLQERVEVEGESVRGSRFIVTLAPVATEFDAKQLLGELRLARPDASHHCWAWRLAVPFIERAGDDGEPGGSAGRPMLAQLAGHNMLDVVVVVTRYFGGTKLGVGGLVRAYGGAVGNALGSARLVPHHVLVEVVVSYGHAFDRQVADLVLDHGGVNSDVSYGVGVLRTFRLPQGERDEFRDRLANVTAGQATIIQDQ